MLLDIGTGELVALAVIAAVLLGPEKVPDLARKAGRVFAFLKGVANNATDQIKQELGPEITDLAELHPKKLIAGVIPNDVSSEMEELRTELLAMRGEVARMKRETEQATKVVATTVQASSTTSI
jgi:sec-independent protein translocase protein TatB